MKKSISYLLIILLPLSCSKPVEYTKPRLTNMTVSVYASVLVQPKELYKVYAEAAGIIKHIGVEEGTLVSKNQVIAKIKKEDISYDLTSARLNQQLAEDNLKGKANRLTSIEIDISRLKNQLAVDSTNYFQQKRLWEKNIGSRQLFEDRKLKYTLSIENLAAAKKRYEQARIELENLYSISQNNYRKSQSLLDNYNITAKKDGKVYQLNKKEGEFIAPQEVFAEIGAADEFIIEMQIDEVDIINIQENQLVIVALDAYPDQVLEARLSKIYPSKNIRTQTFKVEALFTNPPKSLYAGLSGEANIIISKQENVLTIPLDYLKDDNSVITTEGEEIDVELGARNMGEVEIVSGIDSATIILKPEGV